MWYLPVTGPYYVPKWKDNIGKIGLENDAVEGFRTSMVKLEANMCDPPNGRPELKWNCPATPDSLAEFELMLHLQVGAPGAPHDRFEWTVGASWRMVELTFKLTRPDPS